MRLFIIFILCLTSLSSFAQRSRDKPSVIIFLTDDQAYNTMFIMEETNRILGERGVTFTNSFPDNNLCCPSRATYMTGQVSHNHGVLDNSPPDGGYSAFALREHNALPVWLRANGYRTGYIGKFLNGYESKGTGTTHIPPGWDDWQVYARDKDDFYYDYVMNENGTLVSYGSAPEDYGTDVIRTKAERFIRESVAANMPYVLFVAVHAPHSPATPAPRHIGRLAGISLPIPADFNEPDFSDKPLIVQTIPQLSSGTNSLETRWQSQLECLLAVDELVLGLTTVVSQIEKKKTTYYVYTSDNGFFLGSKRIIGKRLVYEQGIHTPLLISGPRVSNNLALPNLVNNVDIVATVLDWTGTTPGNAVDGRSMTKILSGKPTPWRSAILLEAKYGLKGANVEARYSAVRTESDIFIESTSPQFGIESEYYDLSIDPHQLDSINTPSARKTYLSDLLQNLKTCVGESCFVP